MLEATFLQSILADPQDEVARLAYADWLLEQGDPRKAALGEFIQVQSQLARFSEAQVSWSAWSDAAGRRPQLLAREKELREGCQDVLSAGLLRLVQGFEFRRGFIEQVTTSGRIFLQSGEQLFQAAPIQEIRFVETRSPELVATLAASPHLARLTGLDFSASYFGDRGLSALLASPHLGRLRSLNLEMCAITDVGAWALAGSPYLAPLTCLKLNGNPLTLQGVRALADAPKASPRRTILFEENSALRRQEVLALNAELAGTRNPNLLPFALRVFSRGERSFPNVHVRQLAGRIAGNPTAAPELLREGLRDSHRKIRAAAAQLTRRLGPFATALVPDLVRHLFELATQNRAVAETAAMTLAHILPDLSPPLQRWLCILANPLQDPRTNLQTTLENPDFPVDILHAFAILCERRLAWWTRISDPASSVKGVDPAKVSLLPRMILQTVDRLGSLATQAKLKRVSSQRDQDLIQEAAEAKECGWLLARLCELLLPQTEVSSQ
jgi:uncharacterized protein (TIGR02996 family)